MVVHLKIALSAGYRLLPQRAQKTASGRFSAPHCEQYFTCPVGEIGNCCIVGAFTAKNALAANIHAKQLTVVPALGTVKTATADSEDAKNSRVAMHAIIIASTLPARSAQPAVLNKRTLDLTASRLNARIVKRA